MRIKFIVTIFCLFFTGHLGAQVSTYFYGRDIIESQGQTAALYSVQIYENNTRVTVELIPTRNRSRMNYWSSRNTYIVIDAKHELPIWGFIRTIDGKEVVDTSPFTGDWGWNNVKKGQKYYYTMVFHGRIPPGVTNFTLVDRGNYDGSHGYGWSNYTLNNPRIGGTSWTETSVKTYSDKNHDGICGIYEDVSANGNGYKLGCIKENGEYKLLYLGSKERMSWWQIGDVKATLRPSATNGVYKANWYMADKRIESNVHVFFDGISMKTIISLDDTYANSGTEESVYLKMYPIASSNGTASSTVPSEWSGSGFALNEGYFVTNYHVVEDAKSIKVKGVKGNFYTNYNAEVVATDKYNDLALLKINDNRFPGFGSIPYRLKTNTSEVGEDIFVLGYPLTSTMGDEIKLTTGVISSKTGFQGDVSLYQISAPVQPGNSGGPLFDSKGNLIGVVSSKHTGAENVGYAIKALYLKNLVESAVSSSIVPINNTISGQPLTGKVKSVKDFVFMIECSNTSSALKTKRSDYKPSSNVSKDTFYNPKVGYASKGIKVTEVVLGNNETILTVEVIGREWVSISKDNAYLQTNGSSYNLIKAIGVAYSPKRTNCNQEKVEFTLYFKAIPKNTKSFHLVDSENGINVFNIKLE